MAVRLNRLNVYIGTRGSGLRHPAKKDPPTQISDRSLRASGQGVRGAGLVPIVEVYLALAELHYELSVTL